MRRPAALRALVRRARARGGTVGFVPTMGALHDGHVSLLRRARRGHDKVVASVFVNPLQFGPREDFSRYPRRPARDARLCRDAGVDWLFMPSARALYPAGAATRVVPGPLGARWEGAVRPGHFTGVLTVVLKLLQIVEPDTLILGRKDAQQAVLVGAMMRDLDIPARLDVAPIVREPDGLAMSSRNAYLNGEARRRAGGLYLALEAGRHAARTGVREAARVVAAARRILIREARPDAVDYLALVDPRTMEPIRRLDRRGLLIAAIRIGSTRLIDNMAVTPRGRR
ncbi:MAG TPA: pantoate--beta-alanine ligase [Candidatus Eisenbacteria bacterium]